MSYLLGMAKAPLPRRLGCRLRRRCRCCRRGLWWLHYRWTHLQTNTSCCWQTCAMHCITANVLQTQVDAQCDPTNDNACDGRCFRVICRKSPILTYRTCIRHLHRGVTPSEFCWDPWHQKPTASGILCEVVCMILCLAVSVEHLLVTGRHMTMACTVLAWHRMVKTIDCAPNKTKKGTNIQPSV